MGAVLYACAQLSPSPAREGPAQQSPYPLCLSRSIPRCHLASNWLRDTAASHPQTPLIASHLHPAQPSMSTDLDNVCAVICWDTTVHTCGIPIYLSIHLSWSHLCMYSCIDLYYQASQVDKRRWYVTSYESLSSRIIYIYDRILCLGQPFQLLTVKNNFNRRSSAFFHDDKDAILQIYSNVLVVQKY